MENLKVRMYQDGSSVVIYIDDCTPSTKGVIKGLLNAIICPDSSLEAVPREQITVPEGYASFSGKTIEEVLSERGNEGYAVLAHLLHNNVFQLDDKAEVSRIMHEYLNETFSSTDPDEYASAMDEEKANHFLKCFDSLVSSQMKQTVKNILGYASYSDFLSQAPLEQKQSLVCTIIDDIKRL